LVNAIYFKGTWELKFKPERTHQVDFIEQEASFGTPRRVSSCHMMHIEDSFNYYSNTDFEAICLPYRTSGTTGAFGSGNGMALDAVVVLPRAFGGVSLGIENTSRGGGWAKMWSQLKQHHNKRKGQLRLPRFTVETEMALVPTLQQIGVKQLFQYGQADLTPMVTNATGLYVNNVIHKTFVEVNEEGTEAAAVTAMTGLMGFSALPVQAPFDMLCNRPFMFYICDRRTGLRLFMGAVRCPGLQGPPPNITPAVAPAPAPLLPIGEPVPAPAPSPAGIGDLVQSGNPPIEPIVKQAVAALRPLDALTEGVGPTWSGPVRCLFKDGLHDRMGVTQLQSAAALVRAFTATAQDGSASAKAGKLPSLQEIGTQLSETFHIFRTASDVYTLTEGVPSEYALYNMACVLSLAVELQLKALDTEGCCAAPGGCRAVCELQVAQPVPLSRGVGVATSANPIAPALPPNHGSTVLELIQVRLEACTKLLKLAVCAGYPDIEHLRAGDEDLRAVREIMEFEWLPQSSAT